MDLGRNVRDKRKSLNLSQEALARRADVSLNLINRVERGETRDPHYSTLVSIAGALGMSVSELVGEVELRGKVHTPSLLAPPSSNEWDALEQELQQERRDFEEFTDAARYYAKRWREEAEKPWDRDEYWERDVNLIALSLLEWYIRLFKIAAKTVRKTNRVDAHAKELSEAFTELTDAVVKVWEISAEKEQQDKVAEAVRALFWDAREQLAG